jgi:hypothetical protein
MAHYTNTVVGVHQVQEKMCKHPSWLCSKVGGLVLSFWTTAHYFDQQTRTEMTRRKHDIKILMNRSCTTQSLFRRGVEVRLQISGLDGLWNMHPA